MSNGTSDIVEYKGYKLLVIRDGNGFKARIKRSNGDGRWTYFAKIRDHHFDTVKYSDTLAAIERARVIVDSGEIE